VRAAQRVYWMLHKPVGCVTTRRDPEGRRTVYDFLPRDLPFVSAVGRLDRDTSGLLLFTNDTQLAARLTDPRTHVEKRYELRLDAPVDTPTVRRLEHGIELDGRRTLPARVESLPPDPAPRLRMTLVEGRNRQVRRMLEACGRRVLTLHRVEIGPLALGALAVGAARALRAVEVAALQAAVAAVPPPTRAASAARRAQRSRRAAAARG
jgi:23S rRNA pseudouridine2605 synthase